MSSQRPFNFSAGPAALPEDVLRQVAEGLGQASLPQARVDAELTELKALLVDPPEVPIEAPPEPAAPLPPIAAVDLLGSLPTVPIVPFGTNFDSMLEEAGHRSWLDLLRPGTYCRMFLLGRWMTTQLSWVSPTHNLYVFSSRHGGRTHSMTRRMLTKLRNAGLATSIEDGELLAQAMDSLADTGFGAA